MSRLRRAALSALIALVLLGAGAALYSTDPTFNPQPDPPGVTFNPQPDPPGAAQPSVQAGVILNDSPAGVIIQDSPAA